MKKFGFLFAALAFALLASFGFAEEVAATAGLSLGGGLLGLGIGLAFGLAALGVGLAQASIGSAAAGAVAERPELFGNLLIYIVLPETTVIFGLVALFLLQGRLG
jgi:V/A-type H+/Na+-transporting ATPase subunit K